MIRQKQTITNLNEFVAYMPKNIICDIRDSFLPLEDNFNSTSEAIETLEYFAEKATLTYRAPTIEINQNNGTKKIVPAFMPSVSNTQTVISNANKLIFDFVTNNFDYRKIYAKKNKTPDEAKFNEALDKLFQLQTEEEKDKIAHWIWSAARKLHNLPVKYPTMLIFHSTKVGTGKSMLAGKLASILIGRKVPAMNIDYYLDGFSMEETESLPIMFFDEFGTRDKKNLNKLKSMITDNFERIEYKGKNAFTLPSFKSFILTTNDDPKLLTQDITERRYATIEFQSTKGLLSLQEIDELVETLWETVPYNSDDYIDEDVLYSNSIQKSTNETMVDVISSWYYKIDELGMNTLTDIMSHDAITITELVSITKCTKNWAHKILDSGYFTRVSPTSRYYKPNTELFQKIYDSLLNRKDIDDIAIEVDPKDKLIEALQAKIKELEAKLAEKDNPTDPDPTTPTDPAPNKFTTEDIVKFQTPVKDDKFSQPSVKVKENTQFIITARPKPEYIKEVLKSDEKVDAKGEHYLPVFFTFESDDLPLQEQEENYKKLLNGKYKENVFSVTNSGHKSLHTLVFIRPEQAEEIAKDFKYYWNVVGNKLYGTVEHLDKQCASIARLSRLPGGTRDDGSEQTCLYINRDVIGIDLSEEIKEHNKDLLVNSVIRATTTTANTNNEETDELQKLKNIYNKNNNRSEAFITAYEAIVNNDFPSGANYVAAISSLKGMGFTSEFVRNSLFEPAKQLHKTNLTRNFENYWK